MLNFFIVWSLTVIARQATIPADSLLNSYLEEGNLAECGKIIASNSVKDTFLLAEFAYFNYKFEEASDLYKKISPASPECNDALERIIIIKECLPTGQTGSSPDLQDYAQAELLSRQGKSEQGIELLNKLKQNDSPVAPYSSFILIKLFYATAQFENSLKACQNFITGYPEHSKIPEVLLKEAEVYTKLKKDNEAKKIYNDILLKYPKSVVAAVARARLQ